MEFASAVESPDSRDDEISIVLITSPCPSMPALTLINHTLDSLKNMAGLEHFLKHTYILMDGFKAADENRFKKGRISEASSQLYDAYHDALQDAFGKQQEYTVLRSSEHLGFAMMVKWGLELCKTKFALILQHDRYFRLRFDSLPKLLRCFNDHENIRYIGFTTGNSHKHDLLLRSSYRLDYLTTSERIVIDADLSLQPLIFWFDSQHLAHVKRYLEIFTPRRSLPESLRQMISKEHLNRMVLRKGDFIEDRFGQAQRNLFLTWQQDPNKTPDDIIQLFRWFGSYLCWQIEVDASEFGPSASVFVSHLHGRSLDPAFLDNIASTYGVDRISSRQHRQLLFDGEEEEDTAESYTQIRSERRRQQEATLSRLLQEKGIVVHDAEALEEAMQLLQLDSSPQTIDSDQPLHSNPDIVSAITSNDT